MNPHALYIDHDSSEHRQIIEWRHRLHRHPELGFKECQSSDFVAAQLRAFGLEPDTDFHPTGLAVAIEGRAPRTTEGMPRIGLRADLDALPIAEQNRFAHRSKTPDAMHACGHDGHTAMLLGAARQLARTRQFAGTVHLIFQPAEEVGTGGEEMVAQGLFDRHPVDCVYGMHNWPGLEAGHFAIHRGPVMAASEPFDITLYGDGCHAAMPQLGRDPLYAGAQIITALQSIVSRNIDPLQSAVIGVSQFHAGDSHNIVPERAHLQGTVRYLEPRIGALIHRRMQAIVDHTAAALGVRAELKFSTRGSAPVINDFDHAAICTAAARAAAGAKNVHTECTPSLGGEDFSALLKHRPGAYIWIGNGPTHSGEGGGGLHNPNYDFNDDILPLGVNYWLALVEHTLGAQRAAARASECSPQAAL